MLKQLSIPVLALAGSLAAGSAHAGGVHWSIGINVAPPVVAYAPAPAVVYAPPPVYAAPPVVYAPPPPVYYRPAPRVVYYGAPVVAQPEWCPPRGRGWDDGRRDWRGERWHRHHDRYGRY